MNLASYNADKTRIAELESELASALDDLRKANNSKSDWQRRHNKVFGVKITATDRAILMISKEKLIDKNSAVNHRCKEIAKAVKLSFDTVHYLWHKKTVSS